MDARSFFELTHTAGVATDTDRVFTGGSLVLATASRPVKAATTCDANSGAGGANLTNKLSLGGFSALRLAGRRSEGSDGTRSSRSEPLLRDVRTRWRGDTRERPYIGEVGSGLARNGGVKTLVTSVVAYRGDDALMLSFLALILTLRTWF
jgi:hypothetical protein